MPPEIDPELQAIIDKHEKGEELTEDELFRIMGSTEEPPSPEANLEDDSIPSVNVKINGLPGSDVDDDEEDDDPPAKDDTKPDADSGKQKDPKDTASPPDNEGDGNPSDPAKAKTEEQATEQSGLDDAAVARVKEALDQENPNLDGFTPREKGLYYDLKSERASRQEADTRARTAEFENAKLKRKIKELETGETQEDPEEEEDTPEKQLQRANLEVFKSKLELDRIKQSNLPFFEEAIAMADQGWIVDQAKKDLVQQAMNGLLKGQSPYKVTYDLITSDPRWTARKAELEAAKTKTDADSAAKKKAEEEAKIKAEEAAAAKAALEANKSKVKTSGTAGSAGGSDEELLEYDTEKLYNMSEAEFGKLKPEVQEAVLKKLGGL